MNRTVIVLLAAGIGCRSAAAPPEPVLQPVTIPPAITLAAHVAPDSQGVLTGWLDLANTSSSDVRFDHGACAFAVQLRGANDDDARWYSVPAGQQICIMILRTVDVPANSTVAVAAGRIIASPGVTAPPAGRYVANVLLNTGSVQRVNAGTVDLP